MTKGKDDVSGFYKGLGALMALATMGLLGAQILKGHEFDTPDVLIYGIVALLVLALIRPGFASATVRSISRRMPKFSKDE